MFIIIISGYQFFPDQPRPVNGIQTSYSPKTMKHFIPSIRITLWLEWHSRIPTPLFFSQIDECLNRRTEVAIILNINSFHQFPFDTRSYPHLAETLSLLFSTQVIKLCYYQVKWLILIYQMVDKGCLISWLKLKIQPLRSHFTWSSTPHIPDDSKPTAFHSDREFFYFHSMNPWFTDIKLLLNFLI